MRRISEDGACSAGVAIDVDECRSLDAIVALPTDREGGISLVDVDRFGVSIPGQSCSELVGRVKQPRIARFAREQDELTDADHTSGVVGCPTLNVADLIGETKALAVHHALARSTLDAGVCHGTFHQIVWRLAAVRLPLLRPHCHSRLPQWAVTARTGGAFLPKGRWHSCAQQRDLDACRNLLPLPNDILPQRPQLHRAGAQSCAGRLPQE